MVATTPFSTVNDIKDWLKQLKHMNPDTYKLSKANLKELTTTQKNALHLPGFLTGDGLDLKHASQKGKIYTATIHGTKVNVEEKAGREGTFTLTITPQEAGADDEKIILKYNTTSGKLLSTKVQNVKNADMDFGNFSANNQLNYTVDNDGSNTFTIEWAKHNLTAQASYNDYSQSMVYAFDKSQEGAWPKSMSTPYVADNAFQKKVEKFGRIATVLFDTNGKICGYGVGQNFYMRSHHSGSVSVYQVSDSGALTAKQNKKTNGANFPLNFFKSCKFVSSSFSDQEPATTKVLWNDQAMNSLGPALRRANLPMPTGNVTVVSDSAISYLVGVKTMTVTFKNGNVDDTVTLDDVTLTQSKPGSKTCWTSPNKKGVVSCYDKNMTLYQKTYQGLKYTGSDGNWTSQQTGLPQCLKDLGYSKTGDYKDIHTLTVAHDGTPSTTELFQRTKTSSGATVKFGTGKITKDVKNIKLNDNQTKVLNFTDNNDNVWTPTYTKSKITSWSEEQTISANFKCADGVITADKSHKVKVTTTYTNSSSDDKEVTWKAVSSTTTTDIRIGDKWAHDVKFEFVNNKGTWSLKDQQTMTMDDKETKYTYNTKDNTFTAAKSMKLSDVYPNAPANVAELTNEMVTPVYDASTGELLKTTTPLSIDISTNKITLPDSNGKAAKNIESVTYDAKTNSFEVTTKEIAKTDTDPKVESETWIVDASGFWTKKTSEKGDKNNTLWKWNTKAKDAKGNKTGAFEQVCPGDSPNKSVKDSSSNSTLPIVLGVVGGAAVLGGGAYYAMSRNGEKEE